MTILINGWLQWPWEVHGSHLDAYTDNNSRILSVEAIIWPSPARSVILLSSFRSNSDWACYIFLYVCVSVNKKIIIISEISVFTFQMLRSMKFRRQGQWLWHWQLRKFRDSLSKLTSARYFFHTRTLFSCCCKDYVRFHLSYKSVK